MGYRIDLTGNKYGRLNVKSFSGNNSRGVSLWLCECDCGNVKTVPSDYLTTGRTSSCGCISKEHPHNLRHGGKHTKLYNIWRAMKQRCLLKTCNAYRLYGGRGIKVCDEWIGFAKFQEWSLVNGYAEGLSIDRINNDGDYCPNNCRWADIFVQMNNTSRNRVISFRDERETMAEWARSFGLKYSLMSKWVRKGRSMNDIATKAQELQL